jgi:hypothetical protein
MMTVVSCLLACLSFLPEPAQTPVADELRVIRLSLDSYYSRIKSIRLEYDETWGRSTREHPLVKKLESENEARFRAWATSADPGERALVESMRGWKEATLTRQIEILDRYPSARVSVHAVRSFPDGRREEHHTIDYFHDGRRTYVDFEHRRSLESQQGPNDFPDSPLSAVGLRLQSTPNVPLTAVLDLPDITKIEGRETIQSIEAVVITVGPHFPDTHPPVSHNAEEWVKLWLAPSLSFAPLRTEYHRRWITNGVRKPEWDAVNVDELSRYEPTWDEERNEHPLPEGVQVLRRRECQNMARARSHPEPPNRRE